MVKPGDIYFARLDGAGRRRVIVVSREELNRGKYLLVVPCTTSRFSLRKDLPNSVPFHAGQFGFTQDGVAQCELITPMEVSALEIDAGPLGALNASAMRAVIKAVGHVPDSDCEPN